MLRKRVKTKSEKEICDQESKSIWDFQKSTKAT